MKKLFWLGIIYIIFFALCEGELHSFDRNKDIIPDTLRMKYILDKLNTSTDRIQVLPLVNEYIEIAKKQNSKKLLADAYYQTGKIMDYFAESGQTIENFNNALKLYEEVNFISGLIHTNVYIGIRFMSSNNYQQAKEHFYKAYSLIDKSNNYFDKASPSWSLLEIHTKMNQLDSAEYFGKIALKYSNQIPNQDSVNWIFAHNMTYRLLSNLYEKKGNFSKALNYYNLRISLPEVNTNDPIENRFSELAGFFNRQNMPDSAIHYCKIAFRKCKELSKGSFEVTLLKAYQEIIRAFEKQKNFDSAFIYLKALNQINDSLKIDDNDKFAKKSEFNMANEMNKKQIEFQETKNDFIIISSIFVILILSFLIFLIFYRYKLKKNANLKLQSLNKDKDKLFAVISHDLRGPISAFGELTKQINENFELLSSAEIKTNIGNIQKSSFRLSQMMDNLLNWAWFQMGGRKLIFEDFYLKNPVDLAINNLALVAERKKITVISEIDKNILINGDFQAFGIVISNLLANAINFSYKESEIIIRIHNNDLQIIDSGTGINLEEIKSSKIKTGTSGEKGTGLGLEVSREILKLHNCELQFTNNMPQGTIATIKGIVKNEE
jgi:signal transduction histidine kinase